MKSLKAHLGSKLFPALIVGVIIVIGVVYLMSSRAATPFLSVQPEDGTLSAPAARVSDTNASGGSALKFAAGGSDPVGTSTTPNLKVAFVGDTMISSGTKSALALVKNEGAELLVHMGDFDYVDNPAGWEAQTAAALGANFPQIAVIGNHDTLKQADYITQIKNRISRVPAINCTGSIGVQMDCFYKGLHVVGVAPGLSGTGHDTYVRDKLAASNSTWNICAWHVNMTAMQAGTKGNEAGWPVYENCRLGAGIPMSGHEHSYARTKTLSSMTNQTVDTACSNPASPCVAKGKTFSIVNGLGGRTSLDPQSRCLPTTYPYGCKGEWAKFYTTSQGATYAMTFITFNVDGNPNKARGYLKTIAGNVVDTFEITRL